MVHEAQINENNIYITVWLSGMVVCSSSAEFQARQSQMKYYQATRQLLYIDVNLS